MDHRHDYEFADRDAPFAGLLSRRYYRPRLSRAERADIRARLSKHPLLSDLSETEIIALVASSYPFSFPANWTISAQSSCSDMCFLILEGDVEMRRNHEVSRHAGPGDVIGLADAANHRVHHEAAISRTPVSGMAVDSERLLEALVAHGTASGRQQAHVRDFVPTAVAMS